MGASKILIVEDEAFQRKIMRKWLEKEGYECIEAGDGIEALEQLERYNGDIKLIVLDVMMPRMDGIEFIKEVRNKSISAAPVIMCTSVEPDKIRNMDVFALFAKPVDMKAFIGEVDKAFYFGKNQTTIIGKIQKLNKILSDTAALLA